MFKYGVGRNAIICIIIWIIMAVIFTIVSCYDDYKDKKKISKSSIYVAITLIVLSGLIFGFVAFWFQSDHVKVSKIESVLEKNYPGYTDFKYTEKAEYTLTLEDKTTHLVKDHLSDTDPSSFKYKDNTYYVYNDRTLDNKDLVLVFKDQGEKSEAVALFIDGKEQKSKSIKGKVSFSIFETESEEKK